MMRLGVRIIYFLDICNVKNLTLLNSLLFSSTLLTPAKSPDLKVSLLIWLVFMPYRRIKLPLFPYHSHHAHDSQQSLLTHSSLALTALCADVRRDADPDILRPTAGTLFRSRSSRQTQFVSSSFPFIPLSHTNVASVELMASATLLWLMPWNRAARIDVFAHESNCLAHMYCPSSKLV